MRHTLLILLLLVGCGKSLPSNLTAQSNIRRTVHDTVLQIRMLSCNDDHPNDAFQVRCTAIVRDLVEGNERDFELKCDQTRWTGPYDQQTYHESTGCALNAP